MPSHAEQFREEGITSLGEPYELDGLLGLIRQQLPVPEVLCES